MAVSGSPKPDEDEIEECDMECAAPKSHIQCLLKVENGLFNQERWETTCADTDFDNLIEDACEQACADWEDGPNDCNNTVKDDNGKVRWQPFYCSDTGYNGTDGLPPLDDDDDDSADSTGANGPQWEPGSYITYNSSLDVYIIDQALVDAIKDDPTLLALDGTTLEEMTSGSFEFLNITSGSLGDLLGLQNGDVVRSVNGHTANTMEDALNAMAAIYDATSVTLKVNRGGPIVTLDYLIR